MKARRKRVNYPQQRNEIKWTHTSTVIKLSLIGVCVLVCVGLVFLIDPLAYPVSILIFLILIAISTYLLIGLIPKIDIYSLEFSGGITAILILKYFGVLNYLNFALLISAIACFDVYFRQRKSQNEKK